MPIEKQTTDAYFNRREPLLERKNVPCEFILSSTSNNQCGDQRRSLSKKMFYTLRLLQGHRSVGGNTCGSERAIRLELSDEGTTPPLESIDQSIALQPCVIDKKNQHMILPTHIGESLKHRNNQQRQSRSSFLPQSPLTNGTTCHDEVRNFSSNRHCVSEINFSRCPTRTNLISNDPITLYELEVGESDFSDLQQDQALLVDFSNFAKSLIDLLLLCDLGEETETDDIMNSALNQQQSRNKNVQSTPEIRNPLMGCQLNPNSGVIGQDFYHNNAPGLTTDKLFSQRQTSSTTRYVCRLEDCSDKNSSGPLNTWSGKGTRQNIPNTVKFSVVELNQFRELTHLSLNVQEGDDASIRKYLSARLCQTLGQNALLTLQLRKEKEQREVSERLCSEISQKYDQLANQSESEKSALAREAGETIQKEHTRRGEELKHLQQEKDEEIRLLKKASDEFQCKMKTRVEELENKIINILEEKKAIDCDNQKVRGTLSDNEKLVNTLKEKLSRSEKDVLECNEEKTHLEKSLNQLQIHVASLEQSNEIHQQTIAKFEDNKQSSIQSAAKAREDIETYKYQLNEAQQKLHSLGEEHLKTKELLGKYQRDRQEMKRRMKAKVDLIKKQEEVLTTKELESAEMHRRLDEACAKVCKIQSELALKEKEISEANTKVQESKKMLESNQQVITWLNKEMNGAQAQRGRGTVNDITQTKSRSILGDYFSSINAKTTSQNETTFDTNNFITPDLKAPPNTHRQFMGTSRAIYPAHLSNLSSSCLKSNDVVEPRPFIPSASPCHDGNLLRN